MDVAGNPMCVEQSPTIPTHHASAPCNAQGLVSYACDAVAIGVPSISHPIDRFSASLFVLQQVIKYVVFLCSGALTPSAAIVFPSGLAVALYAFNRSVQTVDSRDAQAYFYWHTRWHLAIPMTAVAFYSFR